MNEGLNESLVNRAAGFAYGARLQGQVGKTSYSTLEESSVSLQTEAVFR